MARLEPSGTLVLTKEVRRLYDLPVFTAAGTLSITSYMHLIPACQKSQHFRMLAFCFLFFTQRISHHYQRYRVD
ncbi:Yersinia protein of uncharacterised function (DUF3831) [Yersinia enterocolitica]|nr:Yersinia protein of uncharacterised function (DUF3831) [Yersinia enterocolitica]CNE10836.1 Yersinia protein of uncharacterised function (DUF3831) [Yersinia enterocolitica]